MASTTVLPLLFLLLPAMHGLAAMLALVTHTQVVQPVIAAGTSAVHEAQHAMVAAAGGAASDPTAAAHASAEAPAALGAAAAASSALPPASPPWAWLLLSPIVHPQPDAAAAVEAAASTGTSSAAAAAYHAAGASPAATATAATTVASPSSLWTTWHPLSADLAASGAGGDAQQLAVEGSGSAAGASGAVEDEEDLEEDDVATAWWWSLQLVPLSPPMLLPLGGPDLVGMARVLAMQAMEPSTAILVRNVGREALALMPAILSGFVAGERPMRGVLEGGQVRVGGSLARQQETRELTHTHPLRPIPPPFSLTAAAYTVMRQLAPRRSQVWAIRDALLASDRFFRLHISMARHGNPGSSSLASLASMDEPLGPSSSSSRAPSAAASSSSSAPGGTPPLPPPRESPQGSSSSEQLVGQLAPPGPAAPPAASAVPSSAGASAAVSDAFRKVAVLWLLTRRKVCQLSYLLTSMSVMYLALWWSETGDLAAPATAALISCTLELWLCQREGQQASARNGGGVPPTRGAPPR